MNDPDTHSSPDRETGPVAHQADTLACIAACTALCVAFSDVLLALLMEPDSQTGFLALLPAIGLLAGAAAIAFAILHGLLALERRSNPDEAPLAQSSAIGAFLLSFFVLIWIANLNSFSNFRREPIESLLTLLLLFLVSALVASGARAIALRSARTPETTLALLRGTTLATLALMAATLGVGLWQSHHTLVLGPFLLIAAALLYLTLRLGPIGLGRLPLLLLALFLASPVVPVVAWTPASPASSLDSDGPVRRIVLLTVDTLRRDSLSLYNADSPSPTPALDRLGEDSLIFEKAFSSAPWTVPAFVSMFTGLTPDVHGINHNFPELPEDMKLLAQPLQEKGYLTAAIGNQIQLRRMDRGFDHFRIGPEKSPFHPRTTFGRLLGRRWSADQWTSQRISNLARRWLGENRNQDFFLWVHWIEPHISYAPPTEYLPDPSLSASLGARFEGSLHSSVRAGRVIRSAEEKLWLRELYDAEVRYTDDIVGQVLEQLRELDLYDDTLIVFTSDHGEEFWDHDNWEHGHSVYDEVVAAPLLIKLPGESQSQRITTPVSTASLTRTLLDLANIAPGENPLQSPSLKPLWQGDAAEAEPSTVYIAGVEYFEPQEAIVFDHYKYIARPDSQREELYDLKQDPKETLSLTDSRPALLARGRALLESHRSRVRASASGGPSANGPESEMSPDVEAQLRALGYID